MEKSFKDNIGIEIKSGMEFTLNYLWEVVGEIKKNYVKNKEKNERSFLKIFTVQIYVPF